MGIYTRLSEEDRNKANPEDDSNSIQNQKSMLIQYALAQGWEIYNIYSDDDYTSSDRRRPEFNKLLSDAEAGKFDIVLCKTQSRFTRELELVEKYIHGLFPLWGIRFVSIVDNADTANKGNKKSRQINGLVNEWYLEDMSENIRSVLTNRRENGHHIGSFAPYGYKKDPDVKGHLIIDEEAAAIVREISLCLLRDTEKPLLQESSTSVVFRIRRNIKDCMVCATKHLIMLIVNCGSILQLQISCLIRCILATWCRVNTEASVIKPRNAARGPRISGSLSKVRTRLSLIKISGIGCRH